MTDDVRYCAFCGSSLPHAARFCPQCGRAVVAAVADDPESSSPRAPADAASSLRRSANLIVDFLPVLCAALVVVGSLGPWAVVRVLGKTITVNGTDAEGIITLFFGAVAGLLALVNIRSGGEGRGVGWVVLALFGLVGIVSYWDWSNIERVADIEMTVFGREIVGEGGMLGDVEIGWGLYLVALGAVGGILSTSFQLWYAGGERSSQVVV